MIMLDKNLSEEMCPEIPKLVFENTIVVVPNQNFSKKRIVDLHKNWGYTPEKGIWFEDPEYPDLMYDTNFPKSETNNKDGLFGKGFLDWHLDGPTHPDPEDIISLYCAIPTRVKTHYIDGVSAYEDLSESMKSFIENLEVVIGYTSKEYQKVDLPWFIQCDYEPKCLAYDVRSLHGFTAEEAKEMMVYTYIQRKTETNSNKEIVTEMGRKHHNPNGKWKAVFRKLTITNPLGKTGLFFPPGAIIGFVGVDEGDWKDLYRELWEHLKKFSITRNWNVGDLVLWDNLMVNHKRDQMIENEPRELWRFAIYV